VVPLILPLSSRITRENFSIFSLLIHWEIMSLESADKMARSSRDARQATGALEQEIMANLSEHVINTVHFHLPSWYVQDE